jgi:hypothetical protein
LEFGPEVFYGLVQDEDALLVGLRAFPSENAIFYGPPPSANRFPSGEALAIENLVVGSEDEE